MFNRPTLQRIPSLTISSYNSIWFYPLRIQLMRGLALFFFHKFLNVWFQHLRSLSTIGGFVCRFTYVTAHSPTLLLLHLHYSTFSNPSVALPKSQLILQPFCCFTYITVHSQTLVALPTSQLIFQSFCCFTYVTSSSLTFTWRAAHDLHLKLTSPLLLTSSLI